MPTKNGVEFYAKGNLTEPVFFPNGVLCCNSCWLKKSKTTNKHLRIICAHTYESLNDIDIYTRRGTDCPLEIEEELINGIEK